MLCQLLSLKHKLPLLLWKNRCLLPPSWSLLQAWCSMPSMLLLWSQVREWWMLFDQLSGTMLLLCMFQCFALQPGSTSSCYCFGSNCVPNLWLLYQTKREISLFIILLLSIKRMSPLLLFEIQSMNHRKSWIVIKSKRQIIYHSSFPLLWWNEEGMLKQCFHDKEIHFHLTLIVLPLLKKNQ